MEKRLRTIKVSRKAIIKPPIAPRNEQLYEITRELLNPDLNYVNIRNASVYAHSLYLIAI